MRAVAVGRADADVWTEIAWLAVAAKPRGQAQPPAPSVQAAPRVARHAALAVMPSR